MKNILRSLLLTPVLLLAGCCANNVCDCQDLLADALYLRFDTSGNGRFTTADVARVYLLRYPTTNPRRPLDSATIVTTQARDSLLTHKLALAQITAKIPVVVLSNTAPFGVTSSGKFSQYYYTLRVRKPNAARRDSVFDFNIGAATLTGRYQADGCCTCYENTRKAAYVYDGLSAALRDVTETEGIPKPILLHKPR